MAFYRTLQSEKASLFSSWQLHREGAFDETAIRVRIVERDKWVGVCLLRELLGSKNMRGDLYRLTVSLPTQPFIPQRTPETSASR